MERKGELLQKINNLTGGALSDLLIKHNLCPECIMNGHGADGEGRLERKDEDLCCVSCGLVIDSARFSQNIPFGFQNTPGNKMAMGKGLGGTLGEKGLWCNLAKTNETFKCPGGYSTEHHCPDCPGEFNDLPIRARQMMNQQKMIEHPTMVRLILLGQKKAADWGFDEHRSMRGRLFWNYYGDILRNVGAVVIVKNHRERLGRIADGCLALCLRRQVGEAKFTEAVEKLGLDEAFLNKLVVWSGGIV